jgi:VIT1/CCC1 family predicted Fe2+/Mn2+ transporter
MPPDQAREMAQTMMSDPERALETHAREELGIAPGELGSPPKAAMSSFAAFSVGALVPLLPWFVTEHYTAVLASLVLAVLAAIGVGVATARFTDRPHGHTVIRQLLFTLVPAAITYALGSLINANTG